MLDPREGDFDFDFDFAGSVFELRSLWMLDPCDVCSRKGDFAVDSKGSFLEVRSRWMLDPCEGDFDFDFFGTATYKLYILLSILDLR